MLYIRAVSGEGLVVLDLASFHETLPEGVSPARALKKNVSRHVRAVKVQAKAGIFGW